MADGSITAVVDIDDKDAQKQLTKLKKSIESLEFDTKVKEATKARLESELADLRAAQKAINADDDAAQKAIEKQYDAVAAKIERLTTAINENKDALGVAKTEAGKLADNLAGVGDAGEEAGNRAATAIGKLEKRLVGLAKRVFVFSVITMALRSMRTWMSKAVKSNDAAAVAIARLKGALLTLAQPILNVVIPAFTLLVNILAKIVGAIASVVSALGGTTAKASAEAAESLYDEQNAIEGVGGAAKKASKQLASFDEIQKLSGEDAGGGGGGGAATEGIAPDFSQFMDEEFLDYLDTILNIVELIGAAMLAWKIGSALGLGLGQTIALMAALYASMKFVQELFDMWQNGITFENLRNALIALAVAAAAFGIALGPAAAGITLIVGGLALLATAFHDADENGWNLYNTLTAIAGLLASGLGISILLGSPIPLLIAAIAAVLLALTVATGHGEELLAGLREFIDNFVEFFQNIFEGNILDALSNINQMFNGLKTAIFAVLDGVRDSILSFLDWLDEKTNGKFHEIIELVKSIVTVGFKSAKETVSGVIHGLKQIFSGLTQFISGVFTNDWDRAWTGVKNIFKGIVNGIVSLFEGAMNLIIRGLNWIIEKANTLSIDVPDIFGGGTIGINIPTIPEYKIPRLAAGAVIPPNREFLAVLGDQRSGNNIEAPEAALQAMANQAASANAAYLERIIALLQEGKVMMIGSETFARLVYNTNRSETARHGGALVNVSGRL